MPDDPGSVSFDKRNIGRKFLLQVSHQQGSRGWQDFSTSRSRIVLFVRDGGTVRMVEDPRDPGASSRPLATIPVRGETPDTLQLDLNEGFDRISREEDRTGEDYYGRTAQRETDFLRLHMQEIVQVMRLDSMLILEQRALLDEEPVRVFYYLTPYRPDSGFVPFELRDLDHFGFYETYPQQLAGRSVLYATKFDSHKPVVFALSANFPTRLRQAARDAAGYWNRALGRPLVQVIDAPPGITAPSARYNVLQWLEDRSFASTSHIQADPLTGEILHAHILLDARDLLQGKDAHGQADYVRYIVAHEIGHALGLRHNFARGRVATVMNYFGLAAGMTVGRRIATAREGLEYDRKVMRHVYFGDPIDVVTLPPFCTDGQPRCGPLHTGDGGI